VRDRTAATQAARDGLRARYDPGPHIPEPQRSKMIAAGLDAHMLRMRRASPHGSGSKQRGEKPFGRKKAESFRPDIASRDAPRFGNAFRRFSVRRPVSGLVS